MNRRYLIPPLVVATILTGVGTVSFAATKAKPKPKPKTTNTKLGSIGTAQLPGEWCDFGKAYTLGKSNPINLTVKSAEYTLGHVKVGKYTYYAKEGEKLLVVRFTLHNPVSKEQRIGEGTIQWTAVDAKDNNTRQLHLGVAVEDNDFSILDQSLKPAQKIHAFAIIRVTSEGEIPKLMAAKGGEPSAPVARYDLRGKIKPLDAAYADPDDKTGTTVVKEIKGQMGTTYITGAWDAMVEKIEFINPPLEREGYKKGDVYALVTVQVTFRQDGEGSLGGSGFPASGAELKDADGVNYKRINKWLTASSNRPFDSRAKQGEPIRFKIVFSVPKGVELKSMTLKEWSGYPLVIDLGGLKAQ